MIKIGIIGTGYWGKHHLRILSQLKCELVGIADIDVSRKVLADEYHVAFYQDYKKLLRKVDAVSIVTPPSLHYKLARKALMRGKHVLLEKPFVFKIREAYELKQLADHHNLVLMAGHTYLYHPAILKMKELIKNGEIGNIYYLLMQWLNLGIIRNDVNALWNFGPHPFSILQFLLEELPESISCSGKTFIQNGVQDVVFLSLNYPNGTMATINLSWLHPVKVREVSLVGSKKLIYFNDAQLESPLRIYDKGIAPEEYSQALSWENFAEFKSKVRFGNVEIPKLKEIEPLKSELEDFLKSIEKKEEPIANTDSAFAVVSMLSSAQKSLDKGGKLIAVDY